MDVSYCEMKLWWFVECEYLGWLVVDVDFYV